MCHVPNRVLTASVPWANLCPEQFRLAPCALCGSFSYETLDSVVINWSEFFLVRCPRCKLMWRNPIPDGKFLNDLYGEKYFDDSSYCPELIYQVGIADTDKADQDRRHDLTKKEVRDWMQNKKLRPKDGNGEPRRLLEIGGGGAYLQCAAMEAGWNTIGLEISPRGIKAAITQKLAVFPITLDEFCDKYLPLRQHFHVIVFFDFLEHVADPGRVLRMVSAILEPEGVVILRVPCIEENERPKWHLIDHIWHFTKETIERLLAKEGFQVQVPDSHESGRFPPPDGQVTNYTYFAKKIP